MSTPRLGPVFFRSGVFGHPLCQALPKIAPRLLAVAALALAALPSGAQMATLAATQTSVPISGLATPNGIAYYAKTGTLYVADPANNQILQVTASGAVSQYPTITLKAPQGVAVGPNGNVYIADTGNNRIVKSSGAFTITNASIQEPTGIIVDAADNVYIANTSGNTVIEIPRGLVGTQTTVPASGLKGPTSLAIDLNGDLFIADTGNDRVLEIPQKGGVNASGTQRVVATSADGLGSPAGVGSDATGNLYITDSANNNVIEFPAKGGVAASGTQTTVYTTDLSQPQGVTTDANGNLYISDMGHSSVVYENVQPSRNLGTVAVGGFGDPMVLNYLVEGYAGSSYVPSVKLATGKDASLGTLNCSGGTAPETCSIPATLGPTTPGVLKDAVLVQDPTSHAALTQTLVYGVGQGPLSVFEPGTQTVLNVTGLISPEGLTVDALGNLYIADAGPPQNNHAKTPPGVVIELSAAGTQTTVPATGVVAPYGVTVDGTGDIYVADYGPPTSNGDVMEISPSGTVTTTNPKVGGYYLFSAPTGVTVDGAGNVITADYDNVDVSVLWASGATPTKPLTNANIDTSKKAKFYAQPHVMPLTVAIDSADNLYVADTYDNRVIMAPLTGLPVTVLLASTTTVDGVALNLPAGIAVDSAGTVYVADTGNNRIVEIPAGGGTPTVLTVMAGGLALSSPQGIAVDSLGNLYISDTGNKRIVKVNRSLQALSFPTTNDGVSTPQQIVSVINAGNTSLSLSAAPTVTPNFNLSGTATSCSSSSVMTAGEQCDLGVEFDPTTNGALTGSVSLTDDSLNTAGGATQTVSLSGTGSGYTATMTLTENPGTTEPAGTAVTVTATLSGSNGTPTGNISYTVDSGASQPVALVAGVAKFSLSTTLAVGPHTVAVSYAGDANYTTATPTQSFIYTVAGADATTTALVLTPTASALGQSVTLTATVTPVAGPGSTGTPTGTVSFYNGTTLLGTAVPLTGAGTATMPTTTLPAGTDVLTAVYSGDTNFTGSTSPYEIETVAGPVGPAATTTALLLSPTSSDQGQTITLTATITPATGSTGTPTGSVSFYNGTTLLGTAVPLTGAGTATMPTTTLPAGTDVLTAVYSGDSSFTGSTSAEEIETVAGLNISATLSSTSLTLSPTAASTTDTLTLSSNGGYAGTLQFACAGLPAGATCSFSPATETLTSSSTGLKVTMTVASTSVAALDRREMQRWTPMSPTGEMPGLPMLATAFWMPGWLIAALAGGKGRKKTLSSERARHLMLLVLLLAGVGMMTACGGSSTTPPAASTPATPKGNSSAELVITGTGNVSQVISFTVVVQ